MFWECVNEAKRENKEMGMKAIEEFMAKKKSIFTELNRVKDEKAHTMKVQEYSDLVTGLWNTLMGYELQIVDQLEEVVKDFERNMQELVSLFLENVQTYLGQAREQENIHNEKMMEAASSTLEKAAKNELEEDTPEDLKMLLVDKDTILNAVTTSHDVHLLKIDNKEDDIVTRINNWLKVMIDTIHKEQEIQRNRTRVTEINHLVDHLRDEIDNMLECGLDASSEHSPNDLKLLEPKSELSHGAGTEKADMSTVVAELVARESIYSHDKFKVIDKQLKLKKMSVDVADSQQQL